MVLILTLNICNDYPKYLVNTVQRMEHEKKNTQILMKDKEQKTVHSFFIGTILKEK